MKKLSFLYVFTDIVHMNKVPNRPSGVHYFGARHRGTVWGMSMEGLVPPGQKSPGPGPGSDDHSLDLGRIGYIRLGNESSGTPYPGTNLQPR